MVDNPRDPSSMASKDAAKLDSTKANNGHKFPIGNPLNNLANYTYHIGLLMVKDTDVYATNLATSSASSFDIYDKLDKRYIAATGQFGTTAANSTMAANQLYNMPINITDLTIDSLVSANPKTKNSQSYQWTMQLTEPFGLTLPDKMWAISQDLNVKNWLQSPLFLELDFRGWHESGGPITSPLYRRVHRVNITDMSATTTTAGTVYTVNGIFDGMMAQSNYASITGQSITITATTFIEFLGKLETALNIQQLTKNPGQAASLIYEFRVPNNSKYTSYTLTDPHSNSTQAANNIDMKTSGTIGSGTTITFGIGKDINEIINDVLSRSPEAKSDLMGTRTTSGDNHGQVVYAMIETLSERGAWDEDTQKYQWKVIYVIKDYNRVSNATRGPIELKNNLTDTNKVSNKMSYLVEQGRLAKQYNYLYTGKNTEVISFDVQLSHFWAIMQQKFWIQNADSNTIGATTDKSSIAQVSAQNAKLTQLSQELAKLKSSQDQLKTNIIEIDNQIARSNSQDVSSVNQPFASAGYASVPVATNTGSNIRDDLTSKLSSTTNQITAVEKNIARLTSPSAAQTSRQDEITTQNNESIPSGPLKVSTASPPTARTPSGGGGGTTIQPANGTNIDASGAPNTSTTAYSQLMANIYDGVNMINVDLEIRGDPYWLGDSNINLAIKYDTNYARVNQPVQNANTVASSTTQVDQQSANQQLHPGSEFADYDVGDVSFELNFQTGITPNNDTGLVDFSNNQLGVITNDANSSRTFQGWYTVYEVSHMFREGKFTQRLKAYKAVTDRNVTVQSAIKTASMSNTSTTALPPEPSTMIGDTAVPTSNPTALDSINSAARGPV